MIVNIPFSTSKKWLVSARSGGFRPAGGSGGSKFGNRPSYGRRPSYGSQGGFGGGRGRGRGGGRGGFRGGGRYGGRGGRREVSTEPAEEAESIDVRYVNGLIEKAEEGDEPNKEHKECLKKCLYTENLTESNRRRYGPYRINDVSHLY